MAPNRTTCIIPLRNEILQIFEVMNEISGVRNTDEKICVDDER